MFNLLIGGDSRGFSRSDWSDVDPRKVETESFDSKHTCCSPRPRGAYPAFGSLLVPNGEQLRVAQQAAAPNPFAGKIRDMSVCAVV